MATGLILNAILVDLIRRSGLDLDQPHPILEAVVFALAWPLIIYLAIRLAKK